MNYPVYDFKLLPSNIGIENIEVNSLVSSYNDLFLRKTKAEY